MVHYKIFLKEKEALNKKLISIIASSNTLKEKKKKKQKHPKTKWLHHKKK